MLNDLGLQNTLLGGVVMCFVNTFVDEQNIFIINYINLQGKYT